jgi:hypothetical protein
LAYQLSTRRDGQHLGRSNRTKSRNRNPHLTGAKLVHRPQAKVLPVPIQNALVREMKTRADDPADENRADNLHALFPLSSCRDTHVEKDPQRAWTLMWESARAGSTHAQGEAMHYVVRSRDYQTSTESERRDWSLACLAHKHCFGWDLLSLVDTTVCEKGLSCPCFRAPCSSPTSIATEGVCAIGCASPERFVSGSSVDGVELDYFA